LAKRGERKVKKEEKRGRVWGALNLGDSSGVFILQDILKGTVPKIKKFGKTYRKKRGTLRGRNAQS